MNPVAFLLQMSTEFSGGRYLCRICGAVLLSAKRLKHHMAGSTRARTPTTAVFVGRVSRRRVIGRSVRIGARAISSSVGNATGYFTWSHD